MNQAADDWEQQQYWEHHAAASNGATTARTPVVSNASPGPPEPEASAHSASAGGTATARTREMRAVRARVRTAAEDDGPRAQPRSLRTRLIIAATSTVLFIALATVALAHNGSRRPGHGAVPAPVTYSGDHTFVGPDSPQSTELAATGPGTGGPGLSGPQPPPVRTSPAPLSAPVAKVPAKTRPPAPPTTKSTATLSPVVTAPSAGMVVILISRASGKLVAVSGGSPIDGALIVQSASASTAAQWRLVAAASGCFALINVSSGLALDDPDGSFDDGTQLQQWAAAVGNTNQTWCLRSVGTGWFSVRNLTSGSLLDLRDAGTADGAAIQEWSADPAAPNINQTWRLQRIS